MFSTKNFIKKYLNFTLMRRYEFFSQDKEEWLDITQQAHLGYLGLVDKLGYPRIVPLNFVSLDGNIYFHGALDGEKYELLKENPKASFSVDLPFAFIPSYWESKRSAEPASYFFKSLHIRGRGSIVENLELKAKALQSMMEKYQPEGRYDKVETLNPIYKIPLQRVGVYEVLTEEFTIKLKFGQNYSDKKIQPIIDGLKERDLPMDPATIDNIYKYRAKN
jgi:uncharacterized protein